MPEEAVRFSFTGCLTAEVYRRALYVRLRKFRRVYAALAAAVVPLGILTRNMVLLIGACVLAALPYGVSPCGWLNSGGPIAFSKISPIRLCLPTPLWYRRQNWGKHGCRMSCSTG